MSRIPDQKAIKPAEWQTDKERESVLFLKDVHLTLGEGASRTHVLKGINLDIPASVSVGIVGPSGSGKSTLLMVLGGLERVDEGLVRIAGEDITTKTEDELARFRGENIGIVFQSFHLIPNMTALENVAVPLELAGAEDAYERAASELQAVGLGDRLDHYPGQMSGGEQQRVAIARAVAPSPKLIIADEPTGNLDKKPGEMIADLLLRKRREKHTTLLLVTHDPKLAERCDVTISVSSGRILNSEDAKEAAA